ncbi:MAG TPA: SCO family protein [Stenotrophobium sp.]|jgi:protein SCO1/2|nr:SCO family protein [Stenotrophobium sp.]
MPVLRTLAASLVLIVLGGYTLSAATEGFQAFTTETARRIEVREHPVKIPAVELETASGARVDFSGFRGQWLVVDFIYTRCPTYCSALGGEFAQLQDRLAGPLAQGKLRLLSISFDPGRDTPRQLAAYQQRFRWRGPGWLAARPVTADGLRQLERAFGIIVIPDALGGYVHNTAIHLIDPQGRLVEIMDMGKPDQVAHAVLRKLAL